MIRLANMEDLKDILTTYAYAREYMRLHKNEMQWGQDHPPIDLLKKDLIKKQLFVCEKDGTICGVFAFIIGEDKTYSYIEDGDWLNNKSYGTIHRMASNGLQRGVFHECLEYCKDKIDNIRIDTHHNNVTMQNALSKEGFTKCGIIFLANGEKRIAYHLYNG